MRITLALFIIFWATPLFAGTSVDYDDANCQMALLMDVDEDPLTDSSGTGNTGALKGTGEPDYNATGKFNGCYLFDGSNDYIDVTDDNTFDSTNFTFCFYFNPTNTYDSGLTTDVALIYKDATGANDGDLRINFETSGKIRFLLQGAAADDEALTTTASWTGGTWYHIAIQYDSTQANEMKLWINGSSEDTNNADPNDFANNANNFRFGDESFAVGDDAYAGKLDDMGFFDRVLDSTEINDIMDNGLAPSGGAVIKTINGFALGSVKTYNGLAIGSVKTINGVATQ